MPDNLQIPHYFSDFSRLLAREQLLDLALLILKRKSSFQFCLL